MIDEDERSVFGSQGFVKSGLLRHGVLLLNGGFVGAPGAPCRMIVLVTRSSEYLGSSKSVPIDLLSGNQAAGGRRDACSLSQWSQGAIRRDDKPLDVASPWRQDIQESVVIADRGIQWRAS
jgi:hypothetical protein